MKTDARPLSLAKPFRLKRLSKCALLGALAGLVLAFSVSPSNAQFTLINFDNIPPYPTPVDSFGQMFPGISLVSNNQWIADEVNNSVFQFIQNRSISTFGTAPLWIYFGAPAQNVTMDFGSGELGVSLNISVTGYRAGQLVFAGSFVTSPGPFGADEVRAYNFGVVDEVVVAKTAGATVLTMDNLSFTTVPEPGALSLILMAGISHLVWRKTALKSGE